MKTVCAVCSLVLLVSCSQQPDPPGLRTQLTDLLATSATGHFSIYVEDLASSNSLGLAENEPYDGWSLLKLVVGVTVLKRVELGALGLDHTIELTPELLAVHSTLPAEDRPGDKVTVRELLGQMISLSDNRAAFALSRFTKVDAFQQALMGTGLPQTAPDQPHNALPRVSPRQYANLLRSLYRAGYLQRQHCDLLLQALAETVYASQLPSGVPEGTRVAHMVGYNANRGDFHDCGVVYHPEGAYILCVMSRNSTREEADRMIREVSRIVYDHYAE